MDFMVNNQKYAGIKDPSNKSLEDFQKHFETLKRSPPFKPGPFSLTHEESISKKSISKLSKPLKLKYFNKDQESLF